MAPSSSWIGRTTATFSIIGSSLIIYMILSDRKNKLVRPYHRLMLMLSIFDVLHSTALCASVTAMPRESDIDGAKGNACTCMIQGFLGVLGLAIPLYNSCLNIYYVMIIAYNISSERFAKFEPILHAVSILCPLTLAIVFTVHGTMAPTGNVCSARGKTAIMSYALLFTSNFLICLISMVYICWKVISQAKKMTKYTQFGRRRNSSASIGRVENEKNETIVQAASYLFAFILTYIWPVIYGSYTRGDAEKEPPDAVVVLVAIFYPLQGFWNFLFYIRAGVHREIKANPDKSYVEAVRDVVFHPVITQRSRRRSLPPSPIMDSIDTPGAASYPFYTDEETPNERRLSSVNDNSDESGEGNRVLSFAPLQVNNQEEIPHGYVNNILTNAFSEEDLDIGNKPSNNEAVSSLNHQESVANTSIPQISDGSSLSIISPRSSGFSDVSILEDGIDHQFKYQHTPEKQKRRRSLVSLGSVLNGLYKEDIDGCNTIEP